MYTYIYPSHCNLRRQVKPLFEGRKTIEEEGERLSRRGNLVRDVHQITSSDIDWIGVFNSLWKEISSTNHPSKTNDWEYKKYSI